MDKSLFFIVMVLGCLWLVVDDLIGQRRLSMFAATITPEWKPLNPLQPVKDKMDEWDNNWKEHLKENPDYWNELKKEMEIQNPEKVW